MEMTITPSSIVMAAICGAAVAVAILVSVALIRHKMGDAITFRATQKDAATWFWNGGYIITHIDDDPAKSSMRFWHPTPAKSK